MWQKIPRSSSNSLNQNFAIIIVLILAVGISVGVIYNVVLMQDEADKAGVHFTKMNDGLLLSSLGGRR